MQFLRAPLHITVLAALAVLAAFSGRPALSQAKPVERIVAVLLFDGKLPEQVTLEAEVRKILEPHQAKVDLRTMHAGRAETVPFLRLHDLSRKNAPILLLMSSDHPKARVVKRYPLDQTHTLKQNLRTLMAALRLPAPKPDPVPPGPVVVFATDGSDAEKKHQTSAAGAQHVAEGVRHLGRGSAVVYRLPLPDGLLAADLRAEIGGNYLVEWAGDPAGPWNVLMDSYRYFGTAEDKVRRSTAVASLGEALIKSSANLYVRIHPNGRGTERVQLARLELTALPAGSVSGEDAWVAQAAELRKAHGGAIEAEHAAFFSGTLTKDTRLTADRSPYLMTGDVYVPPNLTLTIEPGVTIKTAGSVILRVQGNLVARGTAKDPILFTSANPRQPDDWKGLHFVPTPLRGSGPKSALQYCRIVNAANVDLQRFAGELSHSIIEGGAAGITLREGGTGKVHHNRFLRCQQGMVLDQASGEVTHNEWQECLVALAVTQLHARAPVKFENNALIKSRIAAVNYLKQSGRPLPALSLANNHWSDTPAARLVGGGSEAGEVRFDPRLEAAPEGVGPGW